MASLIEKTTGHRTEAFDYTRTNALVTGGSEGIGAAIARALVARRVPAIVLVARGQEGLDAIAEELKGIKLRDGGTRVETIAMDLSEPGAAAKVKEKTDAMGLEIDLLVNDAGTGAWGPFDDPQTDSENRSHEDTVALNVAAVVGLAERYLPGMVARDRGGIVNVGSTGAFQPMPYSAVYGASKAFVLSFSQALWAELHDRGYDNVRVVCVNPGITDTGFGAKSGVSSKAMAKMPKSTPEASARVALEALETNSPYRIVGSANTAMAFVSQRLPNAFVASAYARTVRGDALDSEGKASAPKIPESLIRTGLPVLGFVAGWLVLRTVLLRRALD